MDNYVFHHNPRKQSVCVQGVTLSLWVYLVKPIKSMISVAFVQI